MVLAREENRLVAAGCRTINITLIRTYHESRSADAIRCVRKNPYYKNLRDEIRLASQSDNDMAGLNVVLMAETESLISQPENVDETSDESGGAAAPPVGTPRGREPYSVRGEDDRVPEGPPLPLR